MTFTVVWSANAERDFTAILANADDSARIREATARVDYMLRRMARDLGESRDRGFRLWYEDVLGVFYRVDEDVEVLFAGPSRRR